MGVALVVWVLEDVPVVEFSHDQAPQALEQVGEQGGFLPVAGASCCGGLCLVVTPPSVVCSVAFVLMCAWHGPVLLIFGLHQNKLTWH